MTPLLRSLAAVIAWFLGAACAPALEKPNILLIIVDDLGFADEPYYQQSVISLAITQVRDQGVAYYSSAGNSGLPGAEGTQSEDKPISSWQTLA